MIDLRQHDHRCTRILSWRTNMYHDVFPTVHWNLSNFIAFSTNQTPKSLSIVSQSSTTFQSRFAFSYRLSFLPFYAKNPCLEEAGTLIKLQKIRRMCNEWLLQRTQIRTCRPNQSIYADDGWQKVTKDMNKNCIKHSEPLILWTSSIVRNSK